jgi:hypothetical protein
MALERGRDARAVVQPGRGCDLRRRIAGRALTCDHIPSTWFLRIRHSRHSALYSRARSAVARSQLISAPAARARQLTRRHKPRARVPQRSPVHRVGTGTAKSSFVASPSPLPRRVRHKVCAPRGRCRTGRRARLQDGFRRVRGAPSKGKKADERRLAGDRRGFSIATRQALTHLIGRRADRLTWRV